MKVLIIGGGTTTKELLPYKDKLKDNFDYIIGVGGVFQLFDDVMDVHIVSEKFFAQQDMVNDGTWSKTLPRLVNVKAVPRWDKTLNIIPIMRKQLPDNHNLREMIPDDRAQGILVGPVLGDGLSSGSVVLSAIHYAYHKGATEVYTIGAELQFKGELDHCYDEPHRYYRDKVSTHANAAKPMVVAGISTTDYFFASAGIIDTSIKFLFKEAKFYDFSDGLLKVPTQLKLKDYIS